MKQLGRTSILLAMFWLSSGACIRFLPRYGFPYAEGYDIYACLVDESGSPVIPDRLGVAIETDEGLFTPRFGGPATQEYGSYAISGDGCFSVLFETSLQHTIGSYAPPPDIPPVVRVLLTIDRDGSAHEIAVDVTDDMVGDIGPETPFSIPLRLGTIVVPTGE